MNVCDPISIAMHAIKTDSENWDWELLLLEGRTVTIIVSVVLEARNGVNQLDKMHLMMHVDFTSSYLTSAHSFSLSVAQQSTPNR